MLPQPKGADFICCEGNYCCMTKNILVKNTNISKLCLILTTKARLKRTESLWVSPMML